MRKGYHGGPVYGEMKGLSHGLERARLISSPRSRVLVNGMVLGLSDELVRVNVSSESHAVFDLEVIAVQEVKKTGLQYPTCPSHLPP